MRRGTFSAKAWRGVELRSILQRAAGRRGGSWFMLEAGSQPIAGHRLVRRLGVGAFSEVWEAHTPEGGSVALKFLDGRSRYGHLIRGEVRVLQALAELHHPGFIRFHGISAHARY